MVTKPLSRNEMRARAVTFAARWKDETSERGQSQTFWTEFLDIYGVDRKRVAAFEQLAKRSSTGNYGFIDLYWPGVLIAEQKSAGKDLAEAEKQALDYLTDIKQSDFPGLVITSDFAHIRILDLEAKNPQPVEIKTADLGKEYERFLFIAGYAKQTFEQEIEANVEASELMGELYDAAEAAGYKDHEANVLLTRLLFLMFGDDTAMWARGLFYSFVHDRTSDDASDLGAQLAMLFQVLNTPEAERPKNLDQTLVDFPYVNGGLFSENLRIAAFTPDMRHALIKAMRFGWAAISPAVFGSLFQSVKSKELRRELGEHYTPEKTIMKVIAPLFLDDLKERLTGAKGSPQKLRNLRNELATYNFLDPACGCGNFLIVAYREMRRLELQILKQLRDLKEDNQLSLDPTLGLQVSVSQFAGIEIEEWPAKVAETAMFLVDHQMNLELAEEFGQTPDRLPISSLLTVSIGSALTIDWNELLKPQSKNILLGNPPFAGSRLQTASQKKELEAVWKGAKSSGTLDYVSAWFAKAAHSIKTLDCRAAFVATNSITQGEQASIIWSQLHAMGVRITFAHTTFRWESEVSNSAAVHCVVVGMGNMQENNPAKLFVISEQGDAISEQVTGNINGYLINGPNVFIFARSKPISQDAPLMTSGNIPRDGGFLSDLSEDEKNEVVQSDPIAASYLRRIYGAVEHIQGELRWCLWLVDATPQEIRQSKVLASRVAEVRAHRATAVGPKGAAVDRPSLFADIHQPSADFLMFPDVSSSSRKYIPLSFYSRDAIITNKVHAVEGCSAYEFGVIQSRVYMAWVRAVSSRMKSDFNHSSTFVYNNFPWPDRTDAGIASVSSAAAEVLTARMAHKGASLADLYGPLSMPPDLMGAHKDLDKFVLAAYGLKSSATDSEVLSALFTRYEELTAPLAGIMGKKKRP